VKTRSGLVVILLTLAVGGVAIAIVWSVHRAGNPGRLSAAQWQRLKERFARRAAARDNVAPVQGTPTAEPPPVAPPEPPRRPPPPAPDPDVLERQAAEYDADRPKTVVELQRFRFTESMSVLNGLGRTGTATLTNLNPTVNSWHLLELRWDDGDREAYHLANTRPAEYLLRLDPALPTGLTTVSTLGEDPCDLWSAEAPVPLREAARSRSPYALLCDGRVALRITTPGNRTALEWATDFLRDKVWAGEKITVFVRRTLFKDAFIATSEAVEEASDDGGRPVDSNSGRPLPARLADDAEAVSLEPVDLGISLADIPDGRLLAGRWYRVQNRRGIYLSAIEPDLLAPDILTSYPAIAGPLDEVERHALAYLVAFDLDQFDVGFSVGTDHPRVTWSDRVPKQVRDDSLPGPDGIGDISPLVATGIVPPAVADRVAATFTGGFKRAHGAFRTSELAFRNRGSHYGFVDSGVVLSTLQPGLATLFVTADGRVDMRTWSDENDGRLASIAFARQNGLPIVEPDPETGNPRPGARVTRWADGNWSGSHDQRFRTLRAGACLQETTDTRFLVYGYFSTATPSAMARVFQAYQCSYAMLLDINALEHTYLALYRLHDSELTVEHLITGMDVLDKQIGGMVLPRFLGFADNRDFFYLVRRKPGSVSPGGGAPGAPAAAAVAPGDPAGPETHITRGPM
jgi:hypothetical protein